MYNIVWIDDRGGENNKQLNPDAAKTLTDTIVKVNANFEKEPYIMSIASRYRKDEEGEDVYFYNNHFYRIAEEMDNMTCIKTDHNIFSLTGDYSDDPEDADDYRNWYEIVEFLLCKIQKDYFDENYKVLAPQNLYKRIFERFYYAYLNYDNVNISDDIFKNDEYYSKVCEGEDTEIVELCKSLQTMGESTYNKSVELQVPHLKVSEYILSGACPASDETKHYAQVVQNAKNANNKAQIEEDIIQPFEQLGIKKATKTVYLSTLVNNKILDVENRRKCRAQYAYFKKNV